VSDVVGVELSINVVRAVTLDAWRSAPRKTFEAEWDPSRPAEVVAVLQKQLGHTRQIALCVGLGFLHVKQVKLPPAPAAERRRILALEPDRFFAVQDQSVVVSLDSEQSLAFAVDADLLDRWIAAFEEWAPVDSLEPAPFSLARELARAGAHGSFAVAAGANEHGLVEVQEGRLRSARRIPLGTNAPEARPLQSHGGVPADFLPALGAARGVAGSLDEMLLPEAHAGRIRTRRLQRALLTAAMCILAFGVALWALDRSRERTLARIADELSVIEPRAQRSVDLRDRLAAIDRESATIGELARRRADPLRVLAGLSERMPAGATVLGVRANGDEWQIDGTARDAAAIIPLLDSDTRFEGVHFLSATSRFREGSRTYETFSIAFRVRPGA
jgi:hypothetical protein